MFCFNKIMNVLLNYILNILLREDRKKKKIIKTLILIEYTYIITIELINMNIQFNNFYFFMHA